jgi:hypothetical protein
VFIKILKALAEKKKKIASDRHYADSARVIKLPLASIEYTVVPLSNLSEKINLKKILFEKKTKIHFFPQVQCIMFNSIRN